MGFGAWKSIFTNRQLTTITTLIRNYYSSMLLSK